MVVHGTAMLLFAIRAVILTVGETDPKVLESVRALGADTVVTIARPSREAAAAARAAGLAYVPFLPVSEVDRLLEDPAALAALQAIPGIAGFHYSDGAVIEGYTPAAEQERAYGILKTLFPGSRVLFATRLDLVALDPSYLDAYFRPQFTDLVAPYFYPIGTTMLGTYQEDDPWEPGLASLLELLAARMPPGQGVLPVLQAFEQAGFPVGPDFASRQMAVYRAVWPDTDDIAAFWWGGGVPQPLTGMAERPVLCSGFTRLFLGLPPKPVPRAVPRRALAR